MPSTSFLNPEFHYISVHPTGNVADTLTKHIRELYGELSTARFDVLSQDPCILRTPIKDYKDVRCALAIAGIRVIHQSISLMSLMN